MIHKPTPFIETARSIMRPFERSDLDNLALLNSDREVMRYIGEGRTLSKEETEAQLCSIIDHWENHGFGLRAAIYKERNEFIGFCGLMHLDNTAEIEIGYRLAKSYWRMGLATEGARANLGYGFDHHKFDRIVAVAQPENIASQRVLEKIGLTYEKRARYYNTDVKYYAMMRKDYEVAQQKRLLES